MTRIPMAVDRDHTGYVEVTETSDILPVKMLISILWRRKWVILLVAASLTALVVAYSLLQQPMYEASSTILIGQGEGFVEVPTDASPIRDVLTPTLAEAATSQRVAEEAVEKLKLHDRSPQVVAANTSAQAITNTSFLQISYTDPSRKTTKQLADAIAFVFAEQVNELNPSPALSAQLWSKATMPIEPISPDPLRNGVLALLMGLLLGAGLALLLEYLDESIRSLDELAGICGVPALGVIPKLKIPSEKRSGHR